MSEKKGFLGGLFNDDCTILWFIILFLLLFWNYGTGPCDYGYKASIPDTGLTIE